MDIVLKKGAFVYESEVSRVASEACHESLRQGPADEHIQGGM